MSATLALVLGIAACTGTLLATIRVLRPAELTFVYMMIGWLVGELALFHLVAQAAVAGLLIRTGALHERRGIGGVVLLGVSIAGLIAAQVRAGTAAAVIERALTAELGPTARVSPPRWQAWVPFWFDRRGVEVIRDVSYGDYGKRSRLDIFRPAGTTADGALPVVIYIHGGAWVIGHKEEQGQPMLAHLARNGYLGVSINYRLAPRARWPAQITDVKRAIVWVRQHIAEYGGDPSFIAVAGSSAGGHLAALAALTPGDPAFQAGFERADASVDACVPIYAPFDFTDGSALRGRAALHRFLERLVMSTKLSDDEASWKAASPVLRVNPLAPPMLVIQGQLDTLVWREEAREFVAALRKCTAAPLVYVEVPGAQHAFEVFNSVRCREVISGIVQFLDAIRLGSTSVEPHR